MISINCKPYEGFYRKNVLYKINDACTVSFREEHETGKLERVNLVYDLEHHQYGLFAHEFRNPVVRKEGCKTADVLACVVDETQKKIHTIIFDVKSDISAFSDDLLRNESLLTAIKNVKKFIFQIHDEILHKNGFMLYYSDEGFSEEETIGIVTESFEKEKFAAAADLLEQLLSDKNILISKLTDLKLKNNLRPYVREVECLRDFSEEKVTISGRLYDLQIFLLEKISEQESAALIKVAL